MVTGEEEGKGRGPLRKTRRETFTAEHVANNINCSAGLSARPMVVFEWVATRRLKNFEKAHACGLVIEC